IDQIHVFDLADGALALQASYALEPGDEPGRIVEGADNVVYIALRRAGEVVRLDLGSGATDRTRVCGAPRGMAFDVARDALHLACAGGELLTLNAELGVTREVRLNKDLRDVALAQGKLVVSRFRAAEL